MDRKDNVVSLGFVTGLDYADPRLDPQRVLQEFKKHPFVAKLLEGGKMIRYGAKSMPYGGWWAIPPVAGNGWMILGDSAGFLNSARLKGIHLAIKSGMLAAETAFEALRKMIRRRRMLAVSSRRKSSPVGSKKNSGKCRNMHQGFEHGMLRGHVPHRTADDHRRTRRAQSLSREWPVIERMRRSSPSCPRTAAQRPTCSARRRVTASSRSTSSPTCITRARSMKRISRRIWLFTTRTFATRAA